MEDSELVGFEEGLSVARVSTVHEVETKAVISLWFHCMGGYMKRNLGWSDCGTKVVYLRLEAQTQEAEMHFDINDFNISSLSEDGCDAREM